MWKLNIPNVKKDVELIRSFRSFEELGVWISNNYDEIRIIDLIVYED